jgi:hypothetical protein
MLQYQLSYLRPQFDLPAIGRAWHNVEPVGQEYLTLTGGAMGPSLELLPWTGPRYVILNSVSYSIALKQLEKEKTSQK